jgi:isoleucyl-tRNA synthetase
VRDLVLSSDEEKYNVQYSVTADWPVLGKKLKKDMQKVKKALPDVTSADCKQYLSSGKVDVAGIQLIEGDLVVKRSLKDSDSSKDQETNTDNDVLTILDVAIHPELAQEGLAREIINRVQQLRKKANLKPTDDVKMEYLVQEDPDKIGLESVFEGQGGYIEKALRRPVDKHVVTKVNGDINGDVKDGNVIVEEVQEIQKATFLLRLLRL